MDNGHIAILGGQYLCRLISSSQSADFNGQIPRILCSFEVSTMYQVGEERFFSVLNAYGNVRICNLAIGTLHFPTFFPIRPSSYIPMLSIALDLDQITLVEEFRKENDIRIEFDVKLLVSADREKYFGYEKAMSTG